MSDTPPRISPSTTCANASAARCRSCWACELVSLEEGALTGELTVRPELLAPNGFLHAATVIGLADTCLRLRVHRASARDGAKNFTTIELKSNHRRHGDAKGRSSRGRNGRASGPQHAGVGRDRDESRTARPSRCFAARR